MTLPLKVRFLNFFRNFFRIPPVERSLASMTAGKTSGSFVAKFVPNPYQYRSQTFRVMNRDGITMQLDVSDYIGHMVFFGFKDEAIDKLFSLCTPGSNVIDVGTNVGWTLLKMASLSKTGKIIGFEPDPYNYQQCVKNVSMNHFGNISLFPVGLSDVNAELTMEVRTPSNRGGNRIATKGEGHNVKVTRLDDFEPVKKSDHIDLIKIDVEGYELNVLMGAENTVTKHHPVLFIEVNDNNLRDHGHSAGKLIVFLNNAGYHNITNADDGSAVTATDDFANCHFDIIAR